MMWDFEIPALKPHAYGLALCAIKRRCMITLKQSVISNSLFYRVNYTATVCEWCEITCRTRQNQMCIGYVTALKKLHNIHGVKITIKYHFSTFPLCFGSAWWKILTCSWGKNISWVFCSIFHCYLLSKKIAVYIAC